MIKVNFILFWIYVCGLCSGQITITGCPKDWVHYKRTCYKFVSDSPKIYEEADSTCWTYGAILLKVDSQDEHNFVAGWLLQNDILFQSTWFTCGFYVDNHVVWEAEPTNVDNIVTTDWNEEPKTNDIFNRVAYRFSGHRLHRYRWSLVSSSVPSNYICEIPQEDALIIGLPQRDFGYGMGLVNPADLPHGPVMITEPEGVVVYGNTGRPIMLECRVKSNPPAAYQWYRGKKEAELITSTTNERYTLSKGRITIENPEQETDGGWYWCSAENQFGKIISPKVQILFGYLHAFPPVKPDDMNTTAFMGTRISCMTPAYSPKVEYSWFKFHTHNFVYPNHPYHFVSQSGYLYFSSVQPTDDRKYYCVVTLSHTYNMVPDSSIAPSRVSMGTRLNIMAGKNDNRYGPIIFTHVFPSPPLRGSNIRMECIAYGSVPLIYSWRREDGRPFVKGTKLSSRNRVITITSAPLEAQGNYICTVMRTTAHASSVVALVMETSPYFSDPIKDMLVDPGQRVKWLCKAIARPEGVYSWYKDGQLMKNIPGQIEIRRNILVIETVNKERDEGMYQCGATNQHGTAYSTGQLKVISFAPNFDRYPLTPYHLAAEGGEITIPCMVEGAPIPKVSWTKDNSDLGTYPGSLDGRIKMTLANALIVSEIQMSDQGRYECRAKNSNGEASNSTYIRIVHGVVIDKPPQPATVLVNTTHFLYCSASHNYGDIDMAYLWQFNGHEIDFHHNPHFIMGSKNGLQGVYIRNPRHDHSGAYTCVARTPLHTDTKTAMITVVGPPGEPAGVYVDPSSVTSFGSRVIWTVNNFMSHGAGVNGYDIEAETNYYPGEWNAIMTDVQETTAAQDALDAADREDQRSVVVKGLIPDTDYRFRVRAVNYYGRAQKASAPSASIKTPATKPVNAPSDVKGGWGKVGTLTIKWTPLPPAEQCGPGIGYRVYWRLKEEKLGSWQKIILKGNVGMHVPLVGATMYYLQYQVIVGAYNDLGDGPNSTVKVIYSAMGMPVAVTSVTDIVGINGSTNIIYFNQIPDDREHVKGRIKGYQCQYYWNNNGCNPMTGCKLSNLKKKNVWGQADHIMLIDLVLNAEYFFRMQIINTAGKGPIGEWRRGETAGYAPLRYPRFVKVTSVSDHSVRVKWQGVSTTVDEEIITGYKVKVWEVNSDIRNANESTSDRLENEVIIHGLQTKTVYQLRVQGVSAGGDGAMSDPVYFTIKGGQIRIDPGTTQICYEDRTCSAPSSVVSSYVLYILTLTLFYTIIYNNNHT